MRAVDVSEGAPEFRELLPNEILAPYEALRTMCLLGPVYVTEQYFDDAMATVEHGTEQWVVIVNLTPEGLTAWNQLAAMCYEAAITCPSQQLALVFDGAIVSAPLVTEPTFSSGVQISGSFTMQEAQKLADAVNHVG